MSRRTKKCANCAGTGTIVYWDYGPPKVTRLACPPTDSPATSHATGATVRAKNRSNEDHSARSCAATKT